MAWPRIWPGEVPTTPTPGGFLGMGQHFPWAATLSLGPGEEGQIPAKNEGLSKGGMGSEGRVSGRGEPSD